MTYLLFKTWRGNTVLDTYQGMMMRECQEICTLKDREHNYTALNEFC